MPIVLGVSSLLMVATGYFVNKKTPEDIKNMLEVKNRAKASDTAPSKGLFLYKIKY